MATTGLSNNIKTHVVILTNGQKHLINAKTNRMLETASLEDMVELDDGTKVKVSVISNITPITEFYEQYPDKKPDHSRMPNRRQEIDYKSIDDEAKASAAKRTNRELLHILKKLKVINTSEGSVNYVYKQTELAIEEELRARGVNPDPVEEKAYDFDELIETKGLAGMIDLATKTSHIEAMIRGFKRSTGGRLSETGRQLLSRMEHKLQLLKMQERHEQSDWSEGLPDNN